MPRAFFQDGAFFEPDAFFASAVVQAPAVIRLGDPGAALYQLPFRVLGGSVVDLDLLYGVLGETDRQQDIQPIFAIATRSGFIRAWGYEIPRVAIQEACLETFATLLEVDDIVIESSPLGQNLFGSVGLTTRPNSRVTVSDVTGDVKRLLLRELIMFAPAGLFLDINHAIIAPALTGVITDIIPTGSQVTFDYGFSPRRLRVPALRD